MVDTCSFDMARPSLPLSEHRVRVNVSLSKRVYNNCKKQHINISRLVNTMLAFHVGENSGPTRNRTPSLLHVKQTSYHSTIGPCQVFSAEEALNGFREQWEIWQ